MKLHIAVPLSAHDSMRNRNQLAFGSSEDGQVLDVIVRPILALDCVQDCEIRNSIAIQISGQHLTGISILLAVFSCCLLCYEVINDGGVLILRG